MKKIKKSKKLRFSITLIQPYKPDTFKISLKKEYLILSGSGRFKLNIKDMEGNLISVLMINHTTANSPVLTGDFLIEILNYDRYALDVYWGVYSK